MGKRFSHIVSASGKKWDISQYLSRYLKQWLIQLPINHSIKYPNTKVMLIGLPHYSVIALVLCNLSSNFWNFIILLSTKYRNFFHKWLPSIISQVMQLLLRCDAPIPRVRRRYCDVYTQSEIPSRIYAKHQYRQESEYGSIMVTYNPAVITPVHSYYKA